MVGPHQVRVDARRPRRLRTEIAVHIEALQMIVKTTTVYVEPPYSLLDVLRHVFDHGSDPAQLVQSDGFSRRPAKQRRLVRITVTVETIKA